MGKQIRIVIFSVAMVLCSVIVFYKVWYKQPQKEPENVPDVRNTTIQNMVTEGFEENSFVSLIQSLTILSRITKTEYANVEDIKKNANTYGVLLPSNMIYDTIEWETHWKGLATDPSIYSEVTDGNTRYVLPLIDGYMSIRVNQKGFDLLTKGMIPSQLYFYTPFLGLNDYDEIALNRPITTGFLFELLCVYKYGHNSDDKLRLEIIRDYVAEYCATDLGLATTLEYEDYVNAYNFVIISYYGQYKYLKDKGGLTTEYTLLDLNEPLTIDECIALIYEVCNQLG